MTELILKRIQQPKILINRVHPQKPIKVVRGNSMLILERVRTRAWINRVLDELYDTIREMKLDVWFIERLPKNKMGMWELKLDVERYCGRNTFWWLVLENGEWLERAYRKCPKEKAYRKAFTCPKSTIKTVTLERLILND